MGVPFLNDGWSEKVDGESFETCFGTMVATTSENPATMSGDASIRASVTLKSGTRTLSALDLASYDDSVSHESGDRRLATCHQGGYVEEVGKDDIKGMPGFLKNTIEALPEHPASMRPDWVSQVEGPMLQWHQVDEQTFDVNITTSFRAHFAQGREWKDADPEGTLGPAGFMGGSQIGEAKKITLNEASARGSSNTARFSEPASSGSSNDNRQSDSSNGTYNTNKLSTNESDSFHKDSDFCSDPCCVPSGGMSPWEIRGDEVKLINRIAVGGFAEVFKGSYLGTTVAVKKLLEQGPDVENGLRKEVAVLSRLRHPNLLMFMGFCCDPPLIVSEYISRGSLHTIQRERGGPLEQHRQLGIALGVARGMRYLHSRCPPILHSDLKSPNILLDGRWQVKLADFGLSRVRQHSFVSGRTNLDGTPEYMAPEQLRGERFNESADVYSYGVVLWELTSGQVPWSDLSPLQVVGVVGYNGDFLPVPDSGHEELVRLFTDCSRRTACERPNFAAITERLEAVRQASRSYSA